MSNTQREEQTSGKREVSDEKANKQAASGLWIWFIKNWKHVVALLLIIIGIEATVSWYLVQRFHETYIPSEKALTIALDDAGVSQDAATDVKIKVAQKKGEAWYNIRFEEDGTVYVYEVNADDGSIRNSKTE